MRSRTRLLAVLIVLSIAHACSTPPETARPSGPPPTQIAWQRTLEDATRLARATGRPLFFAINMDGESASERIVRENYRDPEFVELTRGCICVVGSLFRHAPRDHDEHGRRIPCPRLGSVTCGEHIALEPRLFEHLQGDRVAPRHVFVDRDGETRFDESLLFDIRDLDRMLVDALGSRDRTAWPRGGDFEAVTAAPDAAARSHLERTVGNAADPATLMHQLEAIRDTGDPGWHDALRLALHRIPELGSGATTELDTRLVATTRAIGATDRVVQALRDALTSVESIPREGRIPLHREPDARLMDLLTELGPEGAQTRSWRVGRSAIADVVSATVDTDLATALAEVGGPLRLGTLLDLADEVSRRHRGAMPLPGPNADALPSIDELITRIETLETELRNSQDDPDLHGALAQTTLDLARQRMDSGASEVPLLLADAAREFEIALAARPERAEWWIEAARTAYFQLDFEREARLARRALTTILGDGPLPDERSLSAEASVLTDALAIEALRWIGDAEARLAAAGGDRPIAVQARGLLAATRALGIVAASPHGSGSDWIGLVSLLESFGLVRASLEANLCAAERLPGDPDVRQSLRSILWSIGRMQLEPATAERVLRRHPDHGVAAWYLGYAHIMAAEDARRAEQPEAAITEYERAERAFDRARSLDDALAESCTHYVGVTWLGRGMAHLLAVRQPEAAEALAKAAHAGASLRSSVDGLQRDVFDLVDQSLEWRAGRPSPVDALALLDRLELADPDTAFWARAISDTMLREGLRADGKNPVRVERETVDAAGDTILMPMGLPTELGDAYLAAAVAAGRRAAPHLDADPKPLAQALTIVAERELERLTHGAEDVEPHLDLARRSLREAAPLSGVPAPATNADREALTETAATLRELLGDARPRFREGR